MWAPTALILAAVPILTANVFQMFSIVLLPVSRPAFRRVNTFLAGRVWGWWGWLLEHANDMKLIVSGDTLPPGENAIVVANHQGMADIMVLVCFATKQRFVQNLKWLVKDIIKYVPGVGWGMLFLDCIFLKRDWARDAEAIKRTFHRISVDRVPLWLLSFPEGTRITPEKLAESKAYAAERGLQPLEHMLFPRPKGFAASVMGLRDHVTAIYSVTIAYHGAPTSFTELWIGPCRHVSIDVRRIPMKDLPVGEAALGDWLTAEFRTKDAALATFNATGTFRHDVQRDRQAT